MHNIIKEFFWAMLLIGLLALLISNTSPVQAQNISWTASTEKLRNYLIIRPMGHPSGYPLALCRVPLYDIPVGTMMVVSGWGNFTNDSNIDNAGVSCELHVCEEECVTYDTQNRFDRVGGIAGNGGANLTKERHHEPVYRYGRIETDTHYQELNFEFQCRAYNKNVVGNQEWVTVDQCGLDVEQHFQGMN